MLLAFSFSPGILGTKASAFSVDIESELMVADTSVVGSIALSCVIECTNKAPWCPVAIGLSSSAMSPELISAIRELNGSLGYYMTELGQVNPSPDPALHAICSRKTRWREDVAAYLRTRTNWPFEAIQCVARYMEGREPEANNDGHRTTAWRKLRKLGPLTAADWTNLGVLVQAASTSKKSREQLAAACGVNIKTLRARSERLIGPLFRKYQDIAGWEWMLELALRRWNYVRDQYPERFDQHEVLNA